MSKTRLYKSLVSSKNYIVITDDINDGHVEPYAAEEFLAQVETIAEHLKQLARQYTLAQKEGEDE